MSILLILFFAMNARALSTLDCLRIHAMDVMSNPNNQNQFILGEIPQAKADLSYLVGKQVPAPLHEKDIHSRIEKAMGVGLIVQYSTTPILNYFTINAFAEKCFVVPIFQWELSESGPAPFAGLKKTDSLKFLLRQPEAFRPWLKTAIEKKILQK